MPQATLTVNRGILRFSTLIFKVEELLTVEATIATVIAVEPTIHI